MSVPVQGAVNAHTHLYSGLSPLGMPAPAPPPASFLDTLARVWWRLDRAHDEASLRAAARLYAAGAALSGTTAVIDHHESPSFIEGSLDVIADACEEIGLAAVLCYGATERNGGRDEARRGLAECRRFIADNRRPHARGVVGLHASFTVSDETIREAGRMARELGTVVHAHVAEDQADLVDARGRGYTGPLQRLLALEALPAGSILAHGVHLTSAEVRRACDLDLWLVQCPRSNRQNRVGYPRHLAASTRVALGTDGFPSDMAEELSTLRAIARERRDDPDAVEARLPAGRALLAERLGAPLHDSVLFVEGAPVTMGGLRWGSPAAVASRPLPQTPWRAGARRAREVTIAGHAVVRGGALVTADLEGIVAEARAAAPGLWERMAALPDRTG
jgi:cytosine/adenosine deaminase-related metal-dependent hydrolase